jgi:hypothetical protein
MARNQYGIDKLPTLYKGICPVYVVRNRDTGLIKFATFTRYNAEDMAKFANGKKPEIGRATGILFQFSPERFEIPCDQIER